MPKQDWKCNKLGDMMPVKDQRGKTSGLDSKAFSHCSSHTYKGRKVRGTEELGRRLRLQHTSEETSARPVEYPQAKTA